MIDKNPLVSVIAVCYNHKKFVIECLDSIINQDYANIELIIMDDCSTDNSVDIIRDWIENYNVDCKFVYHTTNRGICYTLNEALSLVTGDFIKFIATDDLLKDGYLSEMTNILTKSDDKTILAFSDFDRIDEQGQIIYSSHFDKFPREKPANFNTSIKPILPEEIKTIGSFFKKEFFELIGHYDEYLQYEDLDMWLRFYAKQNFKFIASDFIGISYRVVSTSISNDGTSKYVMDTLDIYYKHIQNTELHLHCKERINQFTYKLINYPFSFKVMKYIVRNIFLNRNMSSVETLIIGLKRILKRK